MFKTQHTLAFFILLCALPDVYGTFNQLQLVLRWPASFCKGKKCERTPNNFTIHGLWPDIKGTILNNCNPDAKYASVTGGKFVKRNKHWPDLILTEAASLNSQGFWAYQFKKHGTCCSDLFNQEKYFDLALILKDKFDLLTTFRNKGIIPKSTCTINKIQKTIRTVTGVVPNLSCTPTMELLEVGICFNRDASKLIDCDQPKTCDTSGNTEIFFP
uniref:Ribonuclease n=2 Tax=Solanum peruvianum TaxID=4082 RepID=Q42513_SOLPE|nr:ribonuclease [Solanum peruvianum]AAB36131.1 RNase [Solanum peruvianum]